MFRSSLFAAACSQRTVRRLAGLALTLATLSPAARAQAPDTAFTRLVQKHQFALVPTGTRFSGPGWDKLEQDIRKSTLVLVGEDHGMAQIPGFAAAVGQVLKPKLYVAEIDKYQARDLSRLAAQPGLPTAFSRQYPMAL